MYGGQRTAFTSLGLLSYDESSGDEPDASQLGGKSLHG